MDASELGYEVETTGYRIGGTDYQIRTLRDRQQFSDPDGCAERAGISSASWPMFGILWPAGFALAEEMSRFSIKGKHILEVGCGIGLPSLVLQRRRADITACDYHPLAEEFLRHNADLNNLAPIRFFNTPWIGWSMDLGRFDLIIGSDLLYERDVSGALAGFIGRHAMPAAEVWIVDPDRGNRAAFNRLMLALGFDLSEQRLDQATTPDTAGYKGRLLSYRRPGVPRPA